MQYPHYKPTLESPPLSDTELQALDELLLGLDTRPAAPDSPDADGEPEPMNVEMLDGYLTALLLAPVPVTALEGADWLPAVWGGDGPGDAPFASGKQKKRVIVLVLRHLRAIAQALNHPDRWEPVFSVAETDEGE